ncbi:MAG: hypothetical protein CVU06_03850 [Bacteroidetes bacterium HGW-Bacteroidetes-22]|nr:MAG: hypothetical protein CVU06_03850 [Bacteroidetes bacterium HGW-Bacteroidetes-22]
MKLRISTTLMMMVVIMACRPQNRQLITERYDEKTPKVVKEFQIDKGDTSFTREIQYYPNGQKHLEGALAEGKRDSIWTTWREDGKLWSQATYRNGVEHGVSVAYHPTGAKYYEGRFFKGQRVGIWRFYDETGKEVNSQDFGRVPEQE